MSAASKRWMDLVAQCPCVVCEQIGAFSRTVELHHVAEGSGLRNDFCVVPLCAEHHRGKSGIHGMGTKAFIRLYRPPGDSEYGLLVWTNEEIEAQLWSSTGKRYAA